MFKNRKQAFSGLLIIVLLALLLAACGAATTSSGNGLVQLDQGGAITVVGQGQAYGEPDKATVQVGVETFAETVEEATNQNQATLDQIMTALGEQGIEPENIQTTNYSLWADQRHSETGFEGINGYRVSNQVNVTVLDITTLGDVIAAVTEAGANNIFGINFSVSDPAALESQARANAMADAEARAAELAELAGMQLGEAKVISEVIGQTPMPMGGGAFDMAVAEAAVPVPGISPGQLSVAMQVQVTFAAE